MNEIVVLSGKGGTGKTSISAAFATMNVNTVVADCDVDAANLHLILQPENHHDGTMVTGHKAHILQDKCSSCGVCMEFCSFNAISLKDGNYTISESACDGCVLCWRLCSSEAIELIPSNKSRWFMGDYRFGKLVHARLQPGEENSGKLVSMVRDIAKSYASEVGIDTVIIDGPPGTGCPAISSVTGAAKTLIVTEPTHSGFHDMKRILDLTMSFKVKSYVLINKYDLNNDMTLEIEQWCLQKGIFVVGKIPFDTQIVEAMLNCKSIVEWLPQSEVSLEIKRIWDIIVNDNKKELILK